MQYEDFIYDMVHLFRNWGVWKEIKILCGDKVYKTCEENEGCFRDISYVTVLEMSEREKDFKTRWPEKCEMFVEFNGPLNNLFEFGILETNLEDLPLSKKDEAYRKKKALQEQFQDEYDVEEIMIYPEAYDIPSELEFDSADEYRTFVESEMDRLEQDFIANLSGTVEYDNELEAELCMLCGDYELSYKFTGDGLYIGPDFF